MQIVTQTEDMNMEEYNDYEAHSPAPQPEASRPTTHKSLGTLFGPNTNHYAVSSLCSCLNQHLSDKNKLDPSVPQLKLLSTIQTMADEGYIPDDKIMEDVLLDRHALDDNDGDLCKLYLPTIR